MTLESILEEVERMKASLAVAPLDPAQEPELAFRSPDLTALARSLNRLRRNREAVFGANLFADPAWDILLDLFVAREQGQQISVSSLCIAAAVPPTTALRWVHHLIDQDLLERQRDPRDGRRFWIGMKAETHRKMKDLLSQFVNSAM